MKLCLLLLITLCYPFKSEGLKGFECPDQCNCAETERNMHLNCKWQQINTTNLERIRQFDAVLTLTIKCSHKNGQRANPEPRLFSRLRNLERLEIDRCKMERLPPDLFYGLPKLYNLIVKNAELKEIPANAFQGLTSLMSLDLSGNELQTEPHALFSLTKLLQLDLSKNSIPFISNILTSSTTLKVLSFSQNLIETIDFRRLPSSLTDLNLSKNKISTIHTFAETVTNLTRLDLSGNNLEYIAAKGSLNELPNSLHLLDLSDNKIREVQDGSFEKMTKLSQLDLKNNSITEIEETALEIGIRFRYQLFLSGNPLKCVCENYWILHPKSKSSPLIADISNVTCSHVIDDSRKMTLLDAQLMSGYLCKYDSNCLEGCDCCQRRHEGKCNCYRSCPSGCWCWGSAGANAQRLGQNVVSCNNVRMDRMRYVPNGVTELHLVGSMWKDKGLAQLGRKEYLELLNLSSSSIDHLNKTLLDQFPKLTSLDLSSNKLRTIFVEDLHGLPHLRVLYLHNNELEEPTKNTLDLFGSMQKITLRGNHTSFECECGEKETPFQKWLRKLSNKKKIVDIHEVTCISEEFGVVKIEKMDVNDDETICPKQTTTTLMPTTDTPDTTVTTTKSAVTTDAATESDFTIDNDYMEEDKALELELDATTTTPKVTTFSTTEPSRYAIPTRPAKPTSMLTKISPTLKSITILTTTKSFFDTDDVDEEHFFMNFASNSKAIRTRAKDYTTPAPRKDFDSHILFSVLIVFLLFVVVALICAIISTVYYRLIRPGHYNVQKIHAPRQDEEIPLNGC